MNKYYETQVDPQQKLERKFAQAMQAAICYGYDLMPYYVENKFGTGIANGATMVFRQRRTGKLAIMKVVAKNLDFASQPGGMVNFQEKKFSLYLLDDDDYELMGNELNVYASSIRDVERNNEFESMKDFEFVATPWYVIDAPVANQDVWAFDDYETPAKIAQKKNERFSKRLAEENDYIAYNEKLLAKFELKNTPYKGFKQGAIVYVAKDNHGKISQYVVNKNGKSATVYFGNGRTAYISGLAR